MIPIEGQDARGRLVQPMWAMSAIVASVALAVCAAWPIYGTTRVIAVAAGGLVIGALSVLGAKARQWRWWSAAGLAFGGYVIAVVPLAEPSAMTDPGRVGRAVINGVAGIIFGWKQLLTVSTPAGSYQGVLVPFLVVILVGVLAATALATSGKRAAPWAVIPMLAMVVFGAAFGSEATGPDVEIGPVTLPAPWHVTVGGLAVMVNATWLMGRARMTRNAALKLSRSGASPVRQSRESRALQARRHIIAGALVAMALGAGVAAAPVAASLGPRTALRDAVDPVLMLERQPSPLSSYRQYFTGGGYSAELFSVAGAEGVDRIRIAALDSYDGRTFHVGDSTGSATFSREPLVQDAQVLITIGPGYTGVWVPVVSAHGGAPHFEGPRAEELADAYFGSSSLNAGVVVTSDSANGVGLRAGDSYGVAIDDAMEDFASFSSTIGHDPLIASEDVPGLASWVEAQDKGRTGADLAALVTLLRERGYLSHSSQNDVTSGSWIRYLSANSSYVFTPSRSGHSAARIDEVFLAMLEQERRAGQQASAPLLVAGVGDDEQFATAGALLARYLGFESRVVLGVRVGETPEGAGVPSCHVVCTGANVTAWAEARSAGGAWVALDMTPQHQIVPNRIKAGERPPENPTEVVQQGSKVLEPPSSQSDATESTNPDPPVESTPRRSTVATLVTFLTGALALTLVVLPLLVFPVMKSIRRRWRRHGRAAEVAMVGAWEELLDTYTDLGFELPRGLTRAELADVLERPAAMALASQVDEAVFGERSPTGEAATAAWDIFAAERRAVGAEVTMTRRARAVMTPSSFLRTLRVHRQKRLDPRLTGRIRYEL